MTVLLTGAAGFIGHHVLARLLDRGHEVRTLDSLRPDVHGDADWTPGDGVDFIRGDVRDPAVLDRALAGVEAVVHLAAKVGLGVAISDMPDYASSNDVGTAELLAAMARHDVGRLTLASSMVVYGEGLGECPEHGLVMPGPRAARDLEAGRYEPPCPHCGKSLGHALVAESVAPDPRNAYATSKLAQEFYARNWARATGGSAAMLRYHNVYGPGMPKDTPYAGVAAIFLSALRRGEAPRVFEDGGQRRDFIHVADVAAATVAAFEGTTDGVSAYNVGSGTPRTVGDMARALARSCGGPEPVVTGQWRLGDVRHITADSSHLMQTLGWRPEMDFDDGMADLARAR